MRQTIRTTLLISSTALFAAACTNMPTEGQDTAYNTGGYNTAPAPMNNVPEAGPLTADNTPAAATYNTTMAANAPQNIPVATVPQVPAGNNYNNAAVTETNNNSPYDNYAAAPEQSNNTGVDYSQPQDNSNDSYTSYGTGNTTAAANPVTTYYPDNNASYDSYANNGNNNMANNGGYNNAAATGSSAVQVFASGSQAQAEQISQNMRSQGLPAVVDMVNGLYKVRIPYPDEGAARANLIRVRQASGEAGAFITHR